MPESTANEVSIKGVDITLIEAKLPEAVLLETEQLYDDEIPILPRQTFKNTYETIISDKGLHFETKIILVEGKVKEQYCNCVPWSTIGVCKHVGASIIAIRKLIDKANKESQKKNKQKRKKNTLDRILQKVPSEEVFQFIEAYQKKDKLFKLLLSGHFANYMTDEEIEALVESSFPILKKANEKVTPARVNTFLKVAKSLGDHFKNYISQEDYRKAYRISYMLLKKSFYIKSKLSSENIKLIEHHKMLIANFVETLKLIEAPEYKAIIYDQLAQLLSTSYMSADLMEEHMLWLALYQVPSRRAQLIDAIEAYEQYKHDDINSFYFLKTMELLVNQNGRENLIDNFDPQACYRIIKILLAYRTIENATDVLVSFYNQKRLQHQLAKQILSVYKKPDQEFQENTIDYYIYYKKPIYIQWLQKNTADWNQAKSGIIHRIEKTKNPYLSIQFYLITGDYLKAADTLKTTSDFELTKQFDVRLAHHDSEIVIDIYHSLLKTYLNDHFGSNAIDYGQMVLHRAIATLGKLKSDRIKTYLDRTFPDRNVY